jgi:hypothetical protein
MQIINLKKIIGYALLLNILILTPVSLRSARAAGKDRLPELPPICDAIEVPLGNRVLFRSYALGVQIYRWDGTRWNFVAPEAGLYAAPRLRGKIGSHYAGPTWESNSGSTVVASRVDGCTPDPTAIPWLLLATVATDGTGLFERTTFIQRVNTSGGLPPASAGTVPGEERSVPYSAEYYFYRSDH